MMAEETSKETEEKCERMFSQEQYDMLTRCSDKKDMTEWNEWRAKNPDKNVCLDDAKLQGFHLRNTNFFHGSLFNKREERYIDYSGHVYLREANLEDVNAEKAWFGSAHLEKTCWWHTNAEDADFHGAHLEGAQLDVCKLDGCRFSDANLMNGTLTSSSLCGAKFLHSDLRGCGARAVIVDGSTQLWECKVNQRTDFNGVGLFHIRIDPATKQLLQYNIRRMNWERWYGEHPKLKLVVKPFWWMSDYGLSTGRIILTFFGLAIIFANIYYHWGRIAPPGIVENLFIDRTSVVIPWQLVPLRTLYFSIVTMTTLGFGDMYAYPISWFGHILLMVQVILGYVLLGALITRFAVLFTAGGPAGKFSDE